MDGKNNQKQVPAKIEITHLKNASTRYGGKLPLPAGNTQQFVEKYNPLKTSACIEIGIFGIPSLGR